MLIETPRLLLRELEENDAHATNVYERDADVVRHQTFAPRSLAESLAYIEKSMAQLASCRAASSISRCCCAASSASSGVAG